MGQGYSKGYSVRKEGEKKGEAIQQLEECSEELYEMEGFCRQKAAGTRKRIISSFFGGQVGSLRLITSLLLTRKFQTVWLRLHSWERLKLQLGQVLSLG